MKHPSAPMVVAGVALVAASVGGANAAHNLVTSADIQNNTVRSIDLRDNGVRGIDVRNGALTGADIRNRSIRRVDLAPDARAGEPGPQGEQGPDRRATRALRVR
ncbi:MAG: hypothetical protein ACR2N6_04000 [Miltoncostaeaceae bacterium]